jgi:nitrogen fixation protein NifZ
MMLEPLFACGDAVRVVRNIRNDGTYPGQATGTVLVRRGSVGYVHHVGLFLLDQIIYAVHFLDANNRIVGCREHELLPADAPWIPNLFERGDRVTPRMALTINGAVAVQPGTVGEVLSVIREPESAANYHVLFGERLLHVPEGALDEIFLSEKTVA